MQFEIYPFNTFETYFSADVIALHKGKWLLCMHKERSTWEHPSGWIEEGETPLEAAKRELYEETGAIKFNLMPVCKYSFEIDGNNIFSIMYKAEITEMENLPKFEIKEVNFFEKIPDNVTYPEIYSEILKKVR